ncbi:MAG: hypothetical protein R3350_07040, partial [Saprospiraceae bacterium]|nr:hypothetical protein [Saprospiraceae bacterium]
MEKRENLIDVVKTIYEWRRGILYTCLIALLGSIVISLLLPVYYRATTVFLAASPDQAKPELLYGRGTREAGYYGNESDIDRILMISESNELIDFLIDSFSLYRHYDIDSTGIRAPHYIRRAFFEVYEVKKTERNAIELSVEDQDRILAARMANAAQQKIDELTQQLIKKSQKKLIQSYQQNIETKEALLQRLSDSLITVRKKFGIFNSSAQSEVLAEIVTSSRASLVRNRGRLESMENANFN